MLSLKRINALFDVFKHHENVNVLASQRDEYGNIKGLLFFDCCNVNLLVDSDGHVGIGAIMINPAVRGQGFGRETLKLILRCADSLRIPLTLYVKAHAQSPMDTPALVDWYERYGFVKTPRGHARPPAWILTATIASAHLSHDVWSILYHADSIRSGLFDGGCLVFANALINVFGGELIYIANANTPNVATHYGMLVNEQYVDGEGVFDSTESWINSFAQRENVCACDYVVVTGSAPNNDIPDDMRVTKALTVQLINIINALSHTEEDAPCQINCA